MSDDEQPAEAVMDDRALLAAHLAGDREAFGELVHRHRDRLWAVALRTLGNPDDAADAVQNALISAYRGAGSFRGDSAVTTWLHRIVVNACLDLLRRQKVRSADPLPEDGSRHAADPVDAMGARDLAIDVEQALATLPPMQRAALVLVDIEGYPVEDAARMLDCPVGTVKSRCARGRAKLLPLLQHLRNPDGDPAVPSLPTTSDRPEGGEPR
jgi:RNA polymerase sigma-70 factor, ECF subfamily